MTDVQDVAGKVDVNLKYEIGGKGSRWNLNNNDIAISPGVVFLEAVKVAEYFATL